MKSLASVLYKLRMESEQPQRYITYVRSSATTPSYSTWDSGEDLSSLDDGDINTKPIIQC
jgi:hypothetical protein